MGRVKNRHGGKKSVSKKEAKQIIGNVKPKGKSSKGKKKKEKAPMKLLNKILIILVLLLFVAVGGSLAYQFLSKGYITSVVPIIGQEQELFNDGKVTILMVGADTREEEGGVGRSDTIIVGRFNFKEGTTRLISIPRDYYVSIPGYGKTKINAAFAYGGIDLTKETVEKLMGVTIDRTIQIDLETFPEVVYMLEGVDVVMDEALYDEDWQLDLHEGSNLLDGPTALRFVRFRGTAVGDLGRMKRQQLFLRSLAHDIKTKANVFEQTSIISNLLGGLKTNLTLNEALYMFSAYKKFNNFTIDAWTASGTIDYVDGSGSVIIPDSDAAKMTRGFLDGSLVIAQGEENATSPSLITLTERAKLNREAAEAAAEENSSSVNSAASK